jgi:hypothetical protein
MLNKSHERIERIFVIETEIIKEGRLLSQKKFLKQVSGAEASLFYIKLSFILPTFENFPMMTF